LQCAGLRRHDGWSRLLASQAADDDLGMPLDEHLTVVLEAMQSIAPDLGLAGEES
jgi:predicted hydrolase (HD superfamily)